MSRWSATYRAKATQTCDTADTSDTKAVAAPGAGVVSVVSAASRPLEIEKAASAAGGLVPGVPTAWCDGVALMQAMNAPAAITSDRWATLAATSARLLRDHGAELHAAGWDFLDLFGLHATAPAANPSSWGLAWLLGEVGEVLDVATEAVGSRRDPAGARMAFRRTDAATRVGVVPAWTLR